MTPSWYADGVALTGKRAALSALFRYVILIRQEVIGGIAGNCAMNVVHREFTHDLDEGWLAYEHRSAEGRAALIRLRPRARHDELPERGHHALPGRDLVRARPAVRRLVRPRPGGQAHPPVPGVPRGPGHLAAADPGPAVPVRPDRRADPRAGRGLAARRRGHRRRCRVGRGDRRQPGGDA